MKIRKYISVIAIMLGLFSIEANEYLNWTISSFVERKDIKEILVYNGKNELIEKWLYKKVSDDEIDEVFVDRRRNEEYRASTLQFTENQILSTSYSQQGEPYLIVCKTYNSEGKVVFDHTESYEYDWYSDSDELIKKVKSYSNEYDNLGRLIRTEVTGEYVDYIEYSYGDDGFPVAETFYFVDGSQMVSKHEFVDENSYTVYSPYYFFERYHRFSRRIAREKGYKIVRDYLYWKEEDRDESYASFMQIWKRDRLMEYYEYGKQFIIIYENDNKKQRLKNSLLLNNRIAGEYVEKEVDK